jgi:hypothetical protein
MHDPAFGRIPVFNPHLFDMNQGALAFAEKNILECRKRKIVFFQICFILPYSLIVSYSLFLVNFIHKRKGILPGLFTQGCK